jgi:hypothetical protein
VFGIDASSDDEGAGVWGSSGNGTGVLGITTGDGQPGVGALNRSSSGGSPGLLAYSVNGPGVLSFTTGDGYSGVDGTDDSSGRGYGVRGFSDNGTGVYGQTSGDLPGVHGQSDNGTGVLGESGNGYGVAAISYTGAGLFALGADGTAAVFIGSLSKSGGGFRIDHPLDPAGKYLHHSFVESPDMKNVYDGTTVLDGQGRAEVVLPDWFEALNRDFRYQLTALDAPAPDLHIASRIDGGRFTIAGGQAGQQVCWQVTGVRQDAWASAHRIPVEVAKPDTDRGRYLHPDLYAGGEPVTELARATGPWPRPPRPPRPRTPARTDRQPPGSPPRQPDRPA